MTLSSGSPKTSDRVAVVVNGNAKHVTDDLVATLDQIVQSGDLFVSRSLEEAESIAGRIVTQGYTTVVTAGGDGTFVQMVTMITREAQMQQRAVPRFGLLRLGTGNALAWVLGATSNKTGGAIADLARMRTEAGSRSIRLLDVEGMLTPFAGLGIDSISLDDYAKTRELFGRTPLLRHFASGGATYFISIAGRSIPAYLLRPHLNAKIINAGAPAYELDDRGRVSREILEGDVLFDGPTRLVAMSTIPYWGFGARIFPYADERPDRFSLRLANFSSVEVAVHIRGIWNGTYRAKTLRDFLAEKIQVELNQSVPLQVGGDVTGDRTRIEAALAKEPIRVVDFYAPPSP